MSFSGVRIAQTISFCFICVDKCPFLAVASSVDLPITGFFVVAPVLSSNFSDGWGI